MTARSNELTVARDLLGLVERRLAVARLAGDAVAVCELERTRIKIRSGIVALLQEKRAS